MPPYIGSLRHISTIGFQLSYDAAMSDDEMHDSEDQPRHESRGTSEVSVRQGTAQRALLVFRQINLRGVTSLI